MRSVFLIALAGIVLVPASFAARADEPNLDKPQTSLKRIYVPNPKMLQTRDGGGATPGAENRGHQLVDPARAHAQATVTAGSAALAESQDTPAAAARVLSDASRMTGSDAAAVVKPQDR
jgi:hypothetical protein